MPSADASAPARPDLRRAAWALAAALLAFRFWLAAATPITGDEAYFIEWGRWPDWGFYDHPPMIGWWLAALLAVSDAEWWLRLPSVLQPALLALAAAWAVPRLWPEAGGERRWWAALLILAAPINVWNVFITTDTPLVYFSVLSALAWLRATRDDHTGWYVVAGALLCLAVLSKYFVALLGFAYLVDALRLRRAGAWRGLTIAYACTVPALLLMAWWNAGHCWANVMFNFINRHEGAGLSWKTPPLYLATLAYALTPPGLWLWLRRRDGSALWWLAAVPFALFALLSLAKTIGLHWLMSFVPLVMLWLAVTVPTGTLRRTGLFFAGFAALHVAAVLVVARLPLETWRDTRLYDGIVLTFAADKLIERVKPYEAEYALASDGYSNAVTLGYAARRRFLVFGPGSSHARHDDILTDLRALAGRNILVLRKSAPNLEDYRPYFREVELRSFDERGARFYLVFGRGFEFEPYRDAVLAEIRARWYAIPGFLPQTGCYFCERYFGGQTCRRRAAPGREAPPDGGRRAGSASVGGAS